MKGGGFCNCKISIVQVMGKEGGGGGGFCNCKISIVQVMGKEGGVGGGGIL